VNWRRGRGSNLHGLLLRRGWAPIWALVAGILNLPSFPAGTCIGLYAIRVYLQDETAAALQCQQPFLRSTGRLG
jgi:hypothetical protein